MKENQKEESGSNNQATTKKSSSPAQKSANAGAGKSMKEGEEFIKEGHGHDYSTPVAGEDGSTEDQSGNKSKKGRQNPSKSQHTK